MLPWIVPWTQALPLPFASTAVMNLCQSGENCRKMSPKAMYIKVVVNEPELYTKYLEKNGFLSITP